MADHPSRGMGNRVSRIGGWAIMLAGLAFLASAAAKVDFHMLAGQLTAAAWLMAALGALTYAVLLALLARCWLEVAVGRSDVRWALAFRIYGPAVIAKYLPGSIFQYASRQWRGHSHGLEQRSMAYSSLLELGLHVVCAGAVAGSLLLPFGWLAPAIAGVVAAVGLVVIERPLLRAAAFQMLFFVAFAGLMALLAGLIPDLVPLAGQPLAALYLIAWLAGLMVPVAPGGIGVREAAWLALAAPLAPLPALMAFAILARLVSLAGDCLFGLAAYGVDWSARENRQASG